MTVQPPPVATQEPAADAGPAPGVPEPAASPGVTSPAPDAAPAPAPRPPARRRRRVAILLAALVPAVALVLAAGGLLLWDAQYEGRVLPGVHVGDVDLSGLDRDAAAAAIAAAHPYGEGRLVLRTPDGDLAIPYAAVGRRPAVDALVDRAMASGRESVLPDRAIAQVRQALDGTRIEPVLLLDEPALREAVATAVATLDRAPVDATIALGPDGVTTTRAVAGRTADAEAVIAAALDAVRRPDAPADVAVEVAPVAVAPAVDDAAVSEARLRAERLVGDVVVDWRDRHWTIRAARVRTWLRLATTPAGLPTPVVDTTLVAGSLARQARAVAKDPVDAQFLRGRGGKIVGVVASRFGRELDLEATAARIAAELEARATSGLTGSVAVATTRIAPELTTEEARKTAPVMTKLGKWTTYFPISERNYFGANIWRPAELIDGTVLSPGEAFEWWDAIWPVTTARGFGPGGYIRGSYTDPTGALGGGMCSSSTTLFNAAMRAGLRMGARENHTYYIDRYPLGLDATVSISGSSRQTMSFWNDTRHPIVIRAYRIRRGSSGYVRYEIWGVDDGRTVSISKPDVWNVRKATTKVVYVDTLPPGVREQVEYPSNGMDVAVTRVVRNARGRIIHRDTWRTHYALWNGRIEVGRNR